MPLAVAVKTSGAELMPVIQAMAEFQAGAGVSIGVGIGVVGSARGVADGGEAVGAFMRHFEVEICFPKFAVAAGVDLVESARADAAAEVEAGRGSAGLGENLDHATNRFGAIERATGAAQNFDMVDLRQRNFFQRGGTSGGGINAHAVDQHQGMVGVRATNENAAVGARAPPLLVNSTPGTVRSSSGRQAWPARWMSS